MTVKQLLKKLAPLSGDLEVVMSSDEEGNSFSSLQDVSVGQINDQNAATFTDCEEDRTQLDNAVCLWPV